MTEEAKMLLRLILAQEEESDAGQKISRKKSSKKTKAIEEVSVEENNSNPVTLEDFRKADLARARRELYEPHEAINVRTKNVPTWAKYALSLPEAAEYFHIGYNKLREIVRKDKYAEYLMWNGGRVYIKRKLFEEYLDSATEL